MEQGVNRLEANRGTLNQGYDNMARQAYIRKLQSQKALPQLLAAQGIRGGGTESAILALDAAYGENMNQNELARQNALSGLDQAIAELRTSGDLSAVESALNLQQQQLSALQNAYRNQVDVESIMRQLALSQQESERNQYASIIGAYSNDYAAEINRLRAMGVPEDDYRIQMLKAARNQKLREMEEKEEILNNVGSINKLFASHLQGYYV